MPTLALNKVLVDIAKGVAVYAVAHLTLDVVRAGWRKIRPQKSIVAGS